MSAPRVGRDRESRERSSIIVQILAAQVEVGLGRRGQGRTGLGLCNYLCKKSNPHFDRKQVQSTQKL